MLTQKQKTIGKLMYQQKAVLYKVFDAQTDAELEKAKAEYNALQRNIDAWMEYDEDPDIDEVAQMYLDEYDSYIAQH